jgi:uncharacterized protein DUF3300
VAQILMASTYPLELVEAACFAKANPNLTGTPLDEALVMPLVGACLAAAFDSPSRRRSRW